MRAVVLLLCLGCAFCLGGCLDSPVLVNRVLDPTSDNVDYDNPLKNYVPDPAAELTVDDVAAATDMTAEQIEEILYDEPVYSTDANAANVEQPAESGSYSPTGDSSTTAAVPRSVPEGRRTRGGSDNTAPEEGGGGATGGEAGVGEDGSQDAGEEPNEGEGDSKAVEPGDMYNAHGKTENLPTDVESVCAVGETATIVLSIAGADHLAGSSEAFLDDANHKKVFGSEALAGMKACWKGDGTGDADVDTAAIIALHPTAVLLTTGYTALGADAQKELVEAGVSVIAMPQLASDSYIKKSVQVVGHLFSDVTEGESVKRADAYVKTVDSVLDAAKATHGGTVSTYDNVDYGNVTDANPVNPAAGGAESWTVLLTGWDDDAKATAQYNGEEIFTDTGVALAQVGWRQSPVSYYMGCGGAVNNAAAYASYSTESTRLFLNYNENQVSYEWSDLDDSVTVGKDGGSFKQGGTYLLANACDARGNDSEHHLGSPDFNKVIVRTQDIGKKLAAARKDPLGLYTPGAFRTETSVKGYGLVLNSTLLRCYSVVEDALRGDSLYSILVNPCGLVGSWADGSMESFLEAAWVAREFCGYDDGRLCEDVSDFYETFYGYALSADEVSAILEGDYAR